MRGDPKGTLFVLDCLFEAKKSVKVAEITWQ